MSYEAIYNAVRSRITNGDIGQAVESVLRDASLSYYADRVAARAMDAAAEYDRPSTVYKPRLFIDGNVWCAIYGEDIQNGVCGWGKSPAEAFADFDRKWCEELKGGR